MSNLGEGAATVVSKMSGARTVALVREEINPNKTASARALGLVDTAAIAREIIAIPDDQWDTAQDLEANYNKGGAIRQARHVIFRFCDKRTIPFHCFDLPAWDAWRDRLLPIMLEAVKPYGYRDGFFPRIMLAKLPAGGFIAPHVDGAASVSRPHKIHVPIQTNAQAYIFVGDERFHLAEGLMALVISWECSVSPPCGLFAEKPSGS